MRRIRHHLLSSAVTSIFNLKLTVFVILGNKDKKLILTNNYFVSFEFLLIVKGFF